MLKGYARSENHAGEVDIGQEKHLGAKLKIWPRTPAKRSILLNGNPCIVSVYTADLSYWAYGTDHAVVVVSFDAETGYVHDPAFDEHLLAISATEFELA